MLTPIAKDVLILVLVLYMILMLMKAIELANMNALIPCLHIL